MSLGPGYQYDSLVLSQNPLSYWPTRQVLSADLGPRGRTLTTAGGAPALGGSLLASGEAGSIDYPDGSVSLASPFPELDLVPNPCIDAWYRVEGAFGSGFGIVVSGNPASFATENFFLGPVGTDLWWRLNAGIGGTLVIPGAAAVGDLHHVCAWWESGVLYAALDGRVYSQATLDTPADHPTSALIIGQVFNGSIAKVAVWNRPPTAGERLARLKAGSVGGASWR